MTIVRSPTDDQSIDSEQSQSPSWNGSAEIATDAPVECLSSLSDQDIESTHLTSEESKSVEGSSSADSHTVTSPDISLLTGSHSDTDELSSPEKLKQPESRSNTAQSTYTEARLGYKIVIDNIDKNVKPRNMRIAYWLSLKIKRCSVLRSVALSKSNPPKTNTYLSLFTLDPTST